MSSGKTDTLMFVAPNGTSSMTSSGAPWAWSGEVGGIPAIRVTVQSKHALTCWHPERKTAGCNSMRRCLNAPTSCHIGVGPRLRFRACATILTGAGAVTSNGMAGTGAASSTNVSDARSSPYDQFPLEPYRSAGHEPTAQAKPTFATYVASMIDVIL